MKKNDDASDLVHTKNGLKLQCPLCGKLFQPRKERTEFEEHLSSKHPWKGDSCEPSGD